MFIIIIFLKSFSWDASLEVLPALVLMLSWDFILDQQPPSIFNFIQFPWLYSCRLRRDWKYRIILCTTWHQGPHWNLDIIIGKIVWTGRVYVFHLFQPFEKKLTKKLWLYYLIFPSCHYCDKRKCAQKKYGYNWKDTNQCILMFDWRYYRYF